MLDCPEHNQTSPISTSLISMVLLPFTVTVIGTLPAVIGGSSTCHRPASSAVALAVFSQSVTTTDSRASAQPQMRIFCCCCSTMWSPNTFGSRTSARALLSNSRKARLTKIARNLTLRKLVFMVDNNSCWGKIGRTGRVDCNNSPSGDTLGLAGFGCFTRTPIVYWNPDQLAAARTARGVIRVKENP